MVRLVETLTGMRVDGRHVPSGEIIDADELRVNHWSEVDHMMNMQSPRFKPADPGSEPTVNLSVDVSVDLPLI